MTSTVCRVCLDGNVKMHSIQDNKLLEIYEKLSSSKLNTEDGLPTAICYICLSQLQKCCKFSDLARKSTRTLIDNLHRGIRISYNNVTAQNLGETHHLTVTMDHYCVEENEVQIKLEQVAEGEVPVEHQVSLDIQESVLDDIDFGRSPQIEQPLTIGSSVPIQYFYCDYCKTKCTSKKNLIEHLRMHSGTGNDSKKSHACNICNKAFKHNAHLKRHMVVHTKERLHTCNVCNKSFGHANNLNDHMRLHTGERPYVCDICYKTFNHTSSLKQHKLVHAGEKQYTCDYCDMAFVCNGYKKKHMLRHTGERRYKCDICNRPFNRACTLKLHMYLHTGERPHACDICKRTFIQARTLKKHMQNHY